MDPQQSELEELKRQVLELRARVANVEQRLGVPVTARAATPPPLPMQTPAAPAVRPAAAAAFQRIMPTGQAPAVPQPAATTTTDSALRPPPLPQAPVPPARAAMTPPPLRPLEKVRDTWAQAKPARDWEKLIGGRWYAVAGALILVVGIGLFFKWAYDVGLLHVSPVARCFAGAGLGLALLGAGEFLRRKVNAWAAVGAFAAGVGTVYTSVYIAYYMYQLLSAPAAFALLGVTAALGVGVSLRTRLAAVGVVSMLAAYLTPILFSHEHGNPYILPSYLLAILVVGLVPTGWRGPEFAPLRTTAWYGTIILGGGWTMRGLPGDHLPSVLFLATAWALIQGELVWSSKRRSLLGPAAAGGPGALPEGVFAKMRRWRPLTSSFSTTAWATGLGAMALESMGVHDWVAPCGALAATACAACVLAGHLDFFIDGPETDSERLGVCYWVQAAGLLLVAIALAASGSVQVLSWVVLGVCGVTAGVWLRTRAFAVYGWIGLGIGTARLIVYDSWRPALTSPPTPVLGLNLSLWTLLAGITALGWVASGLVFRWRERAKDAPNLGWIRASHFVIALGILLAGGALGQGAQTPAVGVSVVVGTAITLALASMGLGSGGLLGLGLVVGLGGVMLSVATRWWLTSVTGSPAQTTLGLVVGPAMLTPVWVATGWVVLAWACGSRANAAWRVLRHVATAVAVLVAMIAFAHEAADAAAVGFVWLALSLLLLGAARLVKTWHLDLHASLPLVGATVLWVLRWPAIGGWHEAGTPVLYPPFLLALGVVGVSAVLAWKSGRTLGASTSHMHRIVHLAIAIVTFFFGTSLEVARSAQQLASDPAVRGAALSIWWGIFAFALIAAGLWARRKPPRNVGLGLLAVAGLKAVIFDLASAPALWRIVSFIGLGVLMIAVTVIYQKFAAALDPPARPDDTTGG